MKAKIFFLIVFLAICANNLFAQTNEIHIYSKPSEVTVYNTGATMFYKYQVNLKEGFNKIYLDSMPNNLVLTSLRSNCKGKNIIMASNFELEPKIVTNANDLPAMSQKYQDSIDIINLKINEVKALIGSLNKEEELIQNFKYQQVADKQNQVKELIELSSFYSKRLLEVKKDLVKNNQIITEYNKNIANLNKKIESLRKYSSTVNNYQIILDVNAESTGTFELGVSFYTVSASWVLSYDLKVDESSNNLYFIYKANVKQTTGIDWDKVKLTLSNRNPQENNNLPIIYPWILRKQQQAKQYNDYQMDDALAPRTTSVETSSRSKSKASDVMVIDGLSIGNTQVRALNVDYNLSTLYSIKTNGKEHNLVIDEKKLKAELEHYVAPKYDNDAFLVAKIYDWSELNLVNSNANIYFDDTFVGTTYINAQQAKDSLIISLGRDKNISVSRDLSKEIKEKKFWSKNNEHYFGYVIKVKNNSRKQIKIKIEENYPISSTDEVEIELMELSNANNDKDKGILSWSKTIESNKSEEVKILYKIEAPDNYIIR